jgi:ATP-dependent helicase/nuclease subunit B
MTVFSIPAGESFVDALAHQLLKETAGEPTKLSDMLILLPTRRACRALQEGFLRASDGKPLLLPRLQPLGDDDEEEMSGEGIELPPAVPAVTRRLLLTRLVLQLGGGRGGQTPSPDQAARLADELGRLLDQVQTEELSFAHLAKLVPDELARHWQITLDFLTILTEHWPSILAGSGWIDSAERRNRLLTRRAEQWTADPPSFPILAAGSTGSQPATARLLTAIARLPQGRLVLPGLDRRLTAIEQRQLDHTHPQFALLHLVRSLDLTPADVPLWPGCAEIPRARWVAEALRPAATTEDWRHLDAAEAIEAFDGVERLDCPGSREEAAAIALMMREVLETPAQRAALVTPDRALARRVAAELGRFDIEIDDSAGRPLTVTPPGGFLALTARMVGENFAPHAVLAALKHPLAQGGLPPGQFKIRVRRLERLALRGPRPAPGVEGMAALCHKDSELVSWLGHLGRLTKPLSDLMKEAKPSLAALLSAHLALAEGLAATPDEPGGAELWRHDAGQAAHRFAADLADAAPALPEMEGRHYPGLIEQLMDGVTVRPSYGGHPRLAIWGPLEARLQQADLLILGGLNEGSWPPEPAADPWMSRPMRSRFGLAPPERRIGLAAHDFAQGICAPRVMMTRAVRSGGAPTVPSRWLLRLDALLRRRDWPHGDWLAWATALDQADQMSEVRPPAPKPPVEARPRELPVTAIELWMRDPYGLYAQRILKLRALDPIDADPAARDYGSAVHAALERFLKTYPIGPLPPDALPRLIEIGRESLAEVAARPGLWAFWWPRFESIAAWLVDKEGKRRRDIRESFVEISGSVEIGAPAGPFLLTAKADRIDRMTDGSLAIIDYKTGAPPSVKEVAAGFAPQLPLEAMIARQGGFKEIGAAEVGALLFWRLKGGLDGGEERSAGKNVAELTNEAFSGLAELVRRFDDADTPYEARPHPDRAPKYSDYGHLARLTEWSGGEEEE